MPTEILMPALSPTMEEGKLAKWLVEEGQTIKAGDVIAEIETDKATMEVEAVDEGKVSKLLVPGRHRGREGQYADCACSTARASAAAAPAPRRRTPILRRPREERARPARRLPSEATASS